MFRTTCRLFLVLAVGFSCLVPAGLAAAGAVPGGLAGDVAGRIERVLDVVYAPLPEGGVTAREEEVRVELGRAFSYEGMVRRAAGRHWAAFSPEQQRELQDLLVRLLVRAYVSRFGAAERPVLEYRPAVSIAANRHEVPSTAVLAGQRFSLAYRLVEVEGRHEVYDVLIEGVSLVGNYRDQLDAHFQRGDAAGLLAKLRDQLARPGA